MTTVTLNLSPEMMRQVEQVAHAVKRPLESLLTDLLSSALPSPHTPVEMVADMTQMAWLETDKLWQIANGQMGEPAQEQLQQLSQRQADGALTKKDSERLALLRQQYGQVTLRKARAYALLSLRGGKPLLSHL